MEILAECCKGLHYLHIQYSLLCFSVRMLLCPLTGYLNAILRFLITPVICETTCTKCHLNTYLICNTVHCVVLAFIVMFLGSLLLVSKKSYWQALLMDIFSQPSTMNAEFHV